VKIRVLVAEDHPLVREGVIRALERDHALAHERMVLGDQHTDLHAAIS